MVRPVYDSFASMKQSLTWFFKSEHELLGKLVQALGVSDGGTFLDRVSSWWDGADRSCWTEADRSRVIAESRATDRRPPDLSLVGLDS